MSNLNEYQICQWQGSISGAANVPWPVIYIKPDDSLLDFAKKNNNALLVKISNTSSISLYKSLSLITSNGTGDDLISLQILMILEKCMLISSAKYSSPFELLGY